MTNDENRGTVATAGHPSALVIRHLLMNEIVLQKVRALGVADPLVPTAQTLRLVLGAYFTRKVFDRESFQGYMGVLNPSLECLLEGLKAFSLDQSGISHKVQNTVDLAIGVLRTRLERPDISAAEAREIRLAILELVREARDESSEQRILTLGFAAFAATAFVAVLGGIAASLADRKPAGSNLRLPLLRDR